MQKFFLSFISICLFSTNALFPGNDFSSNKKHTFMDERLSQEFALHEICQEHSEKALATYYAAAEDLSNVKELVPDEVFEKIKFYYYSFAHFNLNLPSVTLFERCAYKIANINLSNLENEDLSFIHTLRSIMFHTHVNRCYDSELANLLIRLHLDKKYKPLKKLLNVCLCTAAYLGDACAVRLLLSKGANCDFVNKDDNYYTPLAYALIKEQSYSKIKNKTFDIDLMIHDYELIAEMLIKAGADAKQTIGSSRWGNDNFIFKHTSNVKIFSLFEDQLDELVQRHEIAARNEINPGSVKRLGLDIIINAFIRGNVEFIKHLYANPLYRQCIKNSEQSFMDPAEDYYKGPNIKELYEFLIENGERRTGEPKSLSYFASRCMMNAINALDYECLESFYEQGIIPFNTINSFDDNNTFLIFIIKKANNQTDKKNLIKIIELLMKAGVLPYHKNNFQKTALDYAREMGLHDNIIQALLIAPLIQMIKISKNISAIIMVINFIKKQGGNIGSYRDSNGKTALDYAEELNLDSSIIEALKACEIPNFSE